MKARMPAGFGRPDMNALMRQAQKMQEDMKAKQAELEAAEYTGSAAGVLGSFQLGLFGFHIFLHLLCLTHEGVHIGAAKTCGHSCFHNRFSLLMQCIFMISFSLRNPQWTHPTPAFPVHEATALRWRPFCQRSLVHRDQWAPPYRTHP